MTIQCEVKSSNSTMFSNFRKNKSILPLCIGCALELYDYNLYLHMMIILTPLFFETSSPGVSAVLAMSSLAFTKFIRPIGGIFYGYFADKYGRRKILMISLCSMIVPTMFMGFLPTYMEIGIWAPIAFIILRMAQTFCFGGEMAITGALLLEYSTKENEASNSAIFYSINYIGSALSILVALICTADFMPSWGWRIPFFISILMASLAVYIRRNTVETEEFKKIAASGSIAKNPLKNFFQKDLRSFFCVLGISGTYVMPMLTIFFYATDLLRNKFGLSTTAILLQSLALCVITIILTPLFARIGQKYGAKKIMLSSVLGMLFFSYPMLMFIRDSDSYLSVFAFQYVMTLVLLGQSAMNFTFIPKQFLPQHRVTAGGLTWGLGHPIWSMLGPIIITTVQSFSGDNILGLFAYVLFACLISMTALYFAKYDVGGKAST